MLKNGIRVVTAGPPNAGKSSLFNVLSQSDRAIVTDIPGTTRDVIETPIAIDGKPFVLVDTAGLRDSDDTIERIGIGRAADEISKADILLWLGEAGGAPEHRQLLILHPRADLPDRIHPPVGALAVSSLTGKGIDLLTRELLARAEAILPGEGQPALNQRQAIEIKRALDALRELVTDDIVILADSLRRAREALDRITGRAGMDDMLDDLFGRFCLGK